MAAVKLAKAQPDYKVSDERLVAVVLERQGYHLKKSALEEKIAALKVELERGLCERPEDFQLKVSDSRLDAQIWRAKMQQRVTRTVNEEKLVESLLTRMTPEEIKEVMDYPGVVKETSSLNVDVRAVRA